MPAAPHAASEPRSGSVTTSAIRQVFQLRRDLCNVLPMLGRIASARRSANEIFLCSKGDCHGAENPVISHRVPWNKGKLTGQKSSLTRREIWAIRTKLGPSVRPDRKNASSCSALLEYWTLDNVIHHNAR